MKYRKGNAIQMSEASMSFYFGLGLRFLGFKKKNCFFFLEGGGEKGVLYFSIAFKFMMFK